MKFRNYLRLATGNLFLSTKNWNLSLARGFEKYFCLGRDFCNIFYQNWIIKNHKNSLIGQKQAFFDWVEICKASFSKHFENLTRFHCKLFVFLQFSWKAKKNVCDVSAICQAWNFQFSLCVIHQNFINNKHSLKIDNQIIAIAILKIFICLCTCVWWKRSRSMETIQYRSH